MTKERALSGIAVTRRDLLGAGALASIPTDPSRGKPNIVILLTDDQRYDTIGALGHPIVRTPNMDRIVRSGITLTNAYNMGGTINAVCTPSRAMFLSGQTLFRADRNIVRPRQTPGMARQFDLFPQVFGRSGYRTFVTGKWDNGGRLLTRSFQEGRNLWLRWKDNAPDHYRNLLFDRNESGLYPPENGRLGTRFSSEHFSDAAVEFIENHREDKPFLLYLPYLSPHDPRAAPEKFARMYHPQSMPLPANFLPEHPFPDGLRQNRDELLAPYPRTPDTIRSHIAAYYAMISEVDFQIGRVLDALERTGHMQNTILVFASDNGLAVGQHGLMGKQNLYEHSVRVPLVVSAPGLPRGTRRDAFVYLSDVFPTLCDLAGVPKPNTVEGKSLAGMLRGSGGSPRDSLFFAFRGLHRGLRTGLWKLILFNVDGARRMRLFNLGEDPLEMRDVSGQPSNTRRIREMIQMLKHSMKQKGDPLNLDKPDWGVPESGF